MASFCPGYTSEPFKSLAADYPDASVYPFEDFRVEWGPIFHRGRLDGTARVLLIGQDPGQHENVLRRILVGEAGRRVQGLLGKLGITHRYVMLNALLYSVYGSSGAKYVPKVKVTAYRNQWIAGLLAKKKITAVITFGKMAERAWTEYTKAAGEPDGVAVEHLTHPTFPESAGGTKAEKAANTKTMLTEYNGALQRLFSVVKRDVATPTLDLYGDAFTDADKADIPSTDLPAGVPSWMYDDDGWAVRVGTALDTKRRNITITVPASVIP